MAIPLTLPNEAPVLIPVLQREIGEFWPQTPYPSVLAAQVEQESLWKSGATLRNPKNNGELGAGLGQVTKTRRFDALTEMRTAYPKQFAGWSWDNAWDVEYQLRGVVIKNRDNYNRITWAKTPLDRMAMMDASYNSGYGGLLFRRRYCANLPNCNPGIWFGHMEYASTQSKKPVAGYKQSFADITQTHVKNVIVVRRHKYLFMDKR